MTKAYEFWEWIRQVELKFGVNQIPIPDQYCDLLLNKLTALLPTLQQHGLSKYSGVFADDFVSKFMLKLYKTTESRSMLFDFIKNLIHENLLQEDIYKDLGNK